MKEVVFGKLIVTQVVYEFPALIESERLLRCSRDATHLPNLSQLNSIVNPKTYALKAQLNVTHTRSYTVLSSQRGLLPLENLT